MKNFSLTVKIVCAFCFQSSFLTAQTLTKSYTTQHRTVNINQFEDNWMVQVQHLELTKPGGNGYHDFLQQQKEINQIHYKRQKVKHSKTQKKSSSVALNMDYGFEGNYYNNKVPNDNTLAISNDGLMIAGINSSYLIYDQNNDSILKRATLNSLTFSFNQLLFVKKYDPKFIYDPNEDRFILVFLVGNNPINNHICVAFSSSNNPLDDWNVYMLTGDALGTNHWTDYPAISLTNDELFITGNLLQHNVSWQEGFYQSLIWQIDKTQGYQGNDTLDFNLWSDLKDDSIYIRNIHPVRGARELQSDHQYFLSNKNFSLESDTLYLIHIENTHSSDSASLSMKRVTLDDSYFLSPNGRQYNGKELSTNDSRVLGGIIDKDWIQYVHHSMDTTTGNCGIYHGIIYNYSENPYVESHILSDSIIDFGYPNIASTAINPNEHECVIGFDFTSPVDTNGLACVYMANDRTYRSMQKLVTGDRAIDRLNGNIDRWGDYSGIQRSYNEPCKTWLSGMYGKISMNGSWISRVSVSDTCREPLPHLFLEPEFRGGKLFPNPGIELINYDFTTNESATLLIQLWNLDGKLITTLYDDFVNEGPNRLTFNISSLTIGAYVLTISKGGVIVQREKLVRQ